MDRACIRTASPKVDLIPAGSQSVQWKKEIEAFIFPSMAQSLSESAAVRRALDSSGGHRLNHNKANYSTNFRIRHIRERVYRAGLQARMRHHERVATDSISEGPHSFILLWINAELIGIEIFPKR